MNKGLRIEGDHVTFEVVRSETIRMTQALRDFIRDMVAQSTGNKIQAIKFVRAEYGLGLLEAKSYAQGGTALSLQAGGPLNPAWVEWLMGFPLGWTELDASETRSSRRSRKSSGGQS